MAERDDTDKLTTALTAGAVAAAGVVAADQVVRARARARLGSGFSPEGTSGVSKDGLRQMTEAGRSVQGADREALKKFGAGGSWLINKFTRDDKIVEVNQGKVVEVTGAERAKRLPAFHDITSRVQNVASQNRLPDGLKLFRGTGTRSLGPGVFQPGFTFKDKGFQFASTSLDAARPYYAQAQAKGSRPAMLVIDAGGAKGVSTAATSEFAHTRPVVMPKDTTLRVDRVETGVRRHLFDAKRDYVFASVVDRSAPAVNPQTRSAAPYGPTPLMAKVSTGAAVLAAGAHAALAYTNAKNAGDSEVSAIGQGIGAGVATAALPLAAGGVASLAMKTGLVSKTAMAVVGKAALPLSIAGTAAYYGWRAMQEGKGVSGTAKAAAWGALNGAIPVDLAMQAYGAIKGDKPAPGATAQARQPAPSAEQTQAFTSLNEKFQSSGPQPEANGEGKRGYANPKTQRAAQEARGVANFTDWAQA